jgi:hypothetical protein
MRLATNHFLATVSDPRAADKIRADAAARHARGEVQQSRIKHELDAEAPTETVVENAVKARITREQLKFKEAFEFACNSYEWAASMIGLLPSTA